MAGESGAGAAVDAEGRAVLDPTKNVLDLVAAAIDRQDDLRIAEFKRQDDLRIAESRHLREIAGLRAEYQAELREGEKARINAIREVDVQAVQRAAEVQATQASALAAQVVATADAFRVSLAAALEPLQKDIAELRKSMYEQAGQRARGTETRLNVGTVLGGLSFLVALVGVVVVILIATAN
jgi:hypothetical protein